MEREDIDIYFSSLGDIEVSPDGELEHLFYRFVENFNEIATSLNNIIIEERESSDEIESSFSRILNNGDDNNRSSLYDLYDNYNDFVHSYGVFLDNNPKLNQIFSNWGLDVMTLRELSYDYTFYPLRHRYYDDSRNATIGIQFVGCSYLIVDNLWSIYEFLTNNPNKFEVNDYIYEGCKLLGYKWKDNFHSLMYIPKSPLLIMAALLSFTTGLPMLGKKISEKFNHIEKVGATFAEFPYEFNHQGSVRIFSSPKSGAMSERLKHFYLSDERKLDLKEKLGLAVALFDYKVNKKTFRCVSFAGTRTNCNSLNNKKVMVQNVLTDIFQYLNGPSRTYFASVGILNDIVSSYPKNRIYVFGHSLGGGLMQYSCAAINSKKLIGYGYNSAGLSDNTLKTLPNLDVEKLRCKIEHVCAIHDPVSRLYHQIGEIKYVKSKKGCSAHKLYHLNRALNGSPKLGVCF